MTTPLAKAPHSTAVFNLIVGGFDVTVSALMFFYNAYMYTITNVLSARNTVLASGFAPLLTLAVGAFILISGISALRGKRLRLVIGGSILALHFPGLGWFSCYDLIRQRKSWSSQKRKTACVIMTLSSAVLAIGSFFFLMFWLLALAYAGF
jgi:hypothetical protein